MISAAIGLVTLLAAGVTWAMWTQVLGAGWEPTPKKVVGKMLGLARPAPGGVLYDLGSGDRRIVIEAAKRYGARAVGIEVDPVRVMWSRLVVRMNHLEGLVTIVRGNLFERSLTDAGTVTDFLTKGTNRRLKPMLLTLNQGTKAVSHVWTPDGWTLAASDNDLKIYTYRIGDQTRTAVPAAIGGDLRRPRLDDAPA